MSNRAKLTAIELLKNPTARVIFILGTLVIATIVGGAPNDSGGP
jgi:hypothetical protein